MEFQDFKTNVSNYFLNFKIENEENPIGNAFNKKIMAEENENFYTGRNNLNESSHQFSSQSTVKPDNGYASMIPKKSGRKSLQGNQNINQFNSELLMLKSNSSNT